MLGALSIVVLAGLQWRSGDDVLLGAGTRERAFDERLDLEV